VVINTADPIYNDIGAYDYSVIASDSMFLTVSSNIIPMSE
jgi:hypothetical protein